MSHFSFVFCLICLPSANAFHPRVCGLQPLQPSGLQQPPAGRELRRLQQGNELMEEFWKRKKKTEKGEQDRREGSKVLSWAMYMGTDCGKKGVYKSRRRWSYYTEAAGIMKI